MNFKNMSGFNFGESPIYNAYEHFTNFDQPSEHFQDRSIYEQVHKQSPEGDGRRFSTTYTKNDDDDYRHRIISEDVESREECETHCNNNEDCLGFTYQVNDGNDKCWGLNDLGTEDGSNTENQNIEGWRKVPSVSISTSNDGNWRTLNSWSTNSEDESDYAVISDNTIALGTTVNIRNDVTISEGNTIVNNGTIIVSSGKTLSIYTDFENNNSIQLLNNSTLIINRDTRFINNESGKIRIYSDSTLTLNGVFINKNIEENSIINNGSINTTVTTQNNNIFYYYGASEDNILQGNVDSNIVQNNISERVLSINNVHNDITDSPTLINLENNLLKHIIDENDEEINQYIDVKVIRDGINKTRFEHIGNGSPNIIGWVLLDDDLIYIAEKKETHYLVANTLFKSAKIYLDTYTVNNLVSNLKSMSDINERSNLLEIANKTSETISQSHELSVGISTITLNTARLRLYLQEYDKLISGDNYIYDDRDSTLGTLRNVSKLPCDRGENDNRPPTKDCLLSKLFFRLTEECSDVVTNIQHLTDKLAKFMQRFLFSKTPYSELVHTLAFAQAPIVQIKNLINMWNFILNVGDDDEEWEEFQDAPNIDNAWDIIYNKHGKYNFPLTYKVEDIYNNESKLNKALRNNRILQEYLCNNTSLTVNTNCPNTKSVISTLLENLGSLESLSQTIFKSTSDIYALHNEFIETQGAQLQHITEAPSNIILPSDRVQGEVKGEVNEEVNEEVQEVSKNNLLEFIKNNIIYIVLLILNIVILVKYY